MLDGHEYLAKRGWKGKGNALRRGGISKPIVLTQKKSLSGLGKDRDEAFPFWDHVYSSSLNAIKIKVYNSDSGSDSDNDADGTTVPEFKRTVTGIISNKKPLEGVTIVSEPSSSSPSPSYRLNLLGSAKRDFARRQLYSRFYRGPVVSTPEETSEDTASPTPIISTPPSPSSSSRDIPEVASLQITTPSTSHPKPSSSSISKKRKRDKDRAMSSELDEPSSTSNIQTPESKEERARRKAARRARREEKRAKRELAKASAAQTDRTRVKASKSHVEDTGDGKRRKPKRDDVLTDVDQADLESASDDRARKKKAKRDKKEKHSRTEQPIPS